MPSHIPVNHRLRGTYRVLAGATGVYLLVFGITGLVRTWGDSFFGRSDVTALGLHTNPAFALLSIVAGAVVLIAVIIGRNVDRFVDLWASGLFLVAGAFMLAVSHTRANFLNYDVSAAVVSFIIGTVLLAAGLYGRVGPMDQASAEEEFRHSNDGDPVNHAWAHLPPKPPKRDSKFA